jgi:hypothetical protein
LADNAFQGRVDVHQRVVEAVGQPGGLGGQIIVVPGQHRQLGQGLLVGADPPQGMRHGPRGLGDHVGVAGVGLAFAQEDVGQAPHRQSGRVAHVDAQRSGHGDG